MDNGVPLLMIYLVISNILPSKTQTLLGSPNSPLVARKESLLRSWGGYQTSTATWKFSPVLQAQDKGSQYLVPALLTFQ